MIIDDEDLARRRLRRLLENFPHRIDVVDEADSGIDALEKIAAWQPELIFLDIQMPGKNGFDLLAATENHAFDVIFTTAYDQYAIQAIRFSALDYLLKPIQMERLQETIKKLLKNQTNEQEETVDEDKRKLGINDRVFVKDGERCWFVKLSDVRLFESEGNYIKVYFDGNRPMIHKSLNALDEKLDDRTFFRASRKHIINLSWIEKIEPWFNGGLMVQLKGGDGVEVSRRQAARFKDMMSL